MKPIPRTTIAALLGACALLSARAQPVVPAIGKPVAVDARYLASQSIRVDGKLAGAWRVSDMDGEHVLVLARKAGPSLADPNSGRVENIELAARFHRRVQPGTWREEWAIRDGSDCPGLDVAASFHAADVAFTDLNRDGRVEVTVPYRLFCGGGVDPHIVKVILREGSTKLAIRGQSLLRVPGQAPLGGDYRHDKALLAPERAAYRAHMEAIWRTVSDDARAKAP